MTHLGKQINTAAEQHDRGTYTVGLDTSVFEDIENWKGVLQVFRSISEAQQRLDELNGLRGRLKRMADALVDSFRSVYPSALIHLCRSPDRANTYIRWRHASRTLQMARTELETKDAQKILRMLGSDVTRDWFRYEEYRIQINFYMAMVVYESQRTENHIARLRSLRELRKRFGSPTTSKHLPSLE